MKNLFRHIVLSSMLIVSAYSVKSNNTSNLVKQNIVDTVELSKADYTRLIIYTPTTEIYDDGVFRKSFTGYGIYDFNNKLIINVSPSTDLAVKLKIEAGNYLVKLNSSDLKVYKISVEAGEINEFAIE